MWNKAGAKSIAWCYNALTGPPPSSSPTGSYTEAVKRLVEEKLHNNLHTDLHKQGEHDLYLNCIRHGAPGECAILVID